LIDHGLNCVLDDIGGTKRQRADLTIESPRMIPQQVLTESRQGTALTGERLTKNWLAAAVIVLLWTAGIIFLGLYLLRIFCS
jgi:hypothetical protein